MAEWKLTNPVSVEEENDTLYFSTLIRLYSPPSLRKTADVSVCVCVGGVCDAHLDFRPITMMMQMILMTSDQLAWNEYAALFGCSNWNKWPWICLRMHSATCEIEFQFLPSVKFQTIQPHTYSHASPSYGHPNTNRCSELKQKSKIKRMQSKRLVLMKRLFNWLTNSDYEVWRMKFIRSNRLCCASSSLFDVCAWLTCLLNDQLSANTMRSSLVRLRIVRCDRIFSIKFFSEMNNNEPLGWCSRSDGLRS